MLRARIVFQLVLLFLPASSAASTDFLVPPGPQDNPLGIVTGSDGNLWFTNFESAFIGKLTPQGGVTLFPIPSGGNGAAITLGPDNNVWFTENDVDEVGRVTPAGTISEVELPSFGTAASITRGPDGELWVRELGFGGALVAAIDPANPVTGNILEFFLPDFSEFGGITGGPDGNL